jgi:hypothetical protein
VVDPSSLGLAPGGVHVQGVIGDLPPEVVVIDVVSQEERRDRAGLTGGAQQHDRVDEVQPLVRVALLLLRLGPSPGAARRPESPTAGRPDRSRRGSSERLHPGDSGSTTVGGGERYRAEVPSHGEPCGLVAGPATWPTRRGRYRMPDQVVFKAYTEQGRAKA